MRLCCRWVMSKSRERLLTGGCSFLATGWPIFYERFNSKARAVKPEAKTKAA